ncbi:alpha/beta hydrolase (plasmid) [Rhizobium lusitanum]|uniref:alpha/beta hydrolase fold domain-containing protein n=1 Tax=Rhizobium lusitanum TaxID=293958 RepID=UPI00161A7159|nr:alpha/beta hydrolase fold domain-containing protein [Rhizobium lusitanum]QND46007.1 alpha/beta hydrolase [Rhizobium lusitanum]
MSSVAATLVSAGATVVEPDFGGSEGIVFPQAFEQMFDLMCWLNSHRARVAGRKSPLIMAGEETGGGLAAGLALKARDQNSGMLDGQILISPLLDPSMATASFRGAEALQRDHWSEWWFRYLGGRYHPYGAPSLCSRMARLAPAAVLTAQDDPLRDEGVEYARRLETAGVAVHQHVFPAGTGWATICGAQSCERPAWQTSVRDALGNFFNEIAPRSIPRP